MFLSVLATGASQTAGEKEVRHIASDHTLSLSEDEYFTMWVYRITFSDLRCLTA